MLSWGYCWTMGPIGGMKTTWVVVHTVRTLGSDFDTGSVFPAVFSCDRGHKNVSGQLDMWV